VTADGDIINEPSVVIVVVVNVFNVVGDSREYGAKMKIFAFFGLMKIT
jgi:hypothetical protein